MRFQRGIAYPHPPRGQARKRYTVSPDALRQRRNNLKRTRIRSDRETAIIKRLIWQAPSESGPRPSQRALARELGVWHSYVHGVQKQSLSVGMDVLANGRRVTLDDLDDARRFTAKLREREPGLLAPSRRLYERESRAANEPRVMTADEIISERRHEVAEWKQKNLWRYAPRIASQFLFRADVTL